MLKSAIKAYHLIDPINAKLISEYNKPIVTAHTLGYSRKLIAFSENVRNNKDDEIYVSLNKSKALG